VLAAACSGAAEIKLYLYDEEFDENDNPYVPQMCNPTPSVGGKKAYFKFRVPCSISTNTQTKTAEVPCVPCVDDLVVTDEEFDIYDDSWSLTTRSEMESIGRFFGRFGGTDQTYKYYTIPQNASYISVHFLFYEIGEWNSCNEAHLVVRTTHISLGCFSVDQYDYEVVTDEIYLQRKNAQMSVPGSDKNIHIYGITVTIPSSYYFDLSSLRIGFSFSTGNAIEETSAGIDKLRIVSHGLCSPKRFPVYPSADSSIEIFETLGQSEFSMNSGEEKEQIYNEEFDSQDLGRTNMIIEEFGPYGNFLGRYGNGRPVTSKDYFVNTEALYVSIEFLMYRIGEWSSDDKLVVKVENQAIDMGQFSSDSVTQNHSFNGSVGGIEFSRESLEAPTNIAFSESNDQIHKISLKIPPYYFSNDGKIMLGFDVRIHNSIESASAGFDKLKVFVHNQSTGENVRTVPHCEGEQILADEEFNSQDDSWRNMRIETFGNHGNVLGRYGEGGNYPSKSFDVPIDADQVVINFEFLEIGQWETNDEAFVIVNNVSLPLGNFKDTGDDMYTYPDTEDGGIILTRESNIPPEHIGHWNKKNHIHYVLITIPNRFYGEEGKINFDLVLSLSEDNLSRSCAIDKFKMTAQGTCGIARSLAVHEDAVVDRNSTVKGEMEDRYKIDLEKNKQPKNKRKFSEIEAEEGPYCLAKDFPCDGGDNMVYTCHYSGRQGFQTFCIPENDSEILRYYAKDYCGPCVGGYGGINWNL